jgi:hypothetical protein
MWGTIADNYEILIYLVSVVHSKSYSPSSFEVKHLQLQIILLTLFKNKNKEKKEKDSDRNP